ncbi:DUF3500 domain-containing protein [Pelagicoccus albus]|uniref:DUF3500 domain-containing protein n=1 Tax=Pelagicoccus albus TaxID=415222 RepID=A0A7X1B6Q6_9BACT|nr:DUF3500 domain-containing protein [Pelagicoccus albus]MBC2606670.1 DUF3500 domain-containing protein [Pelagicoccus albus]
MHRIVLNLAAVLAVALPRELISAPALSIAPGSPHVVTVSGEEGENVVLEGSDDLSDGSWTALSTITLGDQPSIFTDDSGYLGDKRFYRAYTFTDESSQKATDIMDAVEAFLNLLSSSEQSTLLFDWDDDTQKTRWSNFPIGIVPRDGLRTGDMSDAQLQAMWNLLSVVLSEEGYEKTLNIVNGDNELSSGSNSQYGDHQYYIAFLGTPSAEDIWMLQFGGHHLAINVFIKGADGSLTPSLTATQPSSYTLDGETIRPMGDEVDKGLALMQSLSASQQSAATIGSSFIDLVLGPGEDGQMIAYEGVQVSTFSDEQKEALVDLAGEWIRILHSEAAENRLAEVRENLDSTYFAWSGPVSASSAAYFRIHGPTVFIEMSPQTMGGGGGLGHYHSIYRDPTNEYGEGL